MPSGKTVRLARAGLLALCALTAGGCASRSSSERFPPGSNSSTVAPDRAQFPRGQTIPPAGFGVDLVDGRATPGHDQVPVRLSLASSPEAPGSHY